MTYQIIPLSNYAKDIAGQSFNKLTAIAPVSRAGDGKIKWLCICECGTEHVASGSKIVCGTTKSCGCCKYRTIHAMHDTPTYSTWESMKSRCDNKRNHAYRYYGGRGITYDKRWISFVNFYADMGLRPAGLSLDRIDNDGNYTPENCRWATSSEQARNTRRNHLVTFMSKTMCLTEWGEVVGIKASVLHKRLKRNWSIEKAFTKPVQIRRM